MRRTRLLSVGSCGLLLVLLGITPALPETGAEPDAAGSWRQWGGPGRDFQVTSTELAESWPKGGPPILWRRDLGEGYSAIVVTDGVLYTMLREGEREVLVALAAASGETRWRFEYEAPTEGWKIDRGAGPHATPALGGARIFSVGSTGKLHAVETSDGSLLWSHDLLDDFSGSFRHRGYSSSPLLYGDAVIAMVGGAGQAVMAFRQDDGSVLWRGGDDQASYSSPILIDLGGEPQLVVLAATKVLGLDPESGEVLWTYPHPTRSAYNISTPVFGDDGVLFLSSAYDGGFSPRPTTAADAASS